MTDSTPPSATPSAASLGIGPGRAALAGILAAGAALGLGELAAALAGGTSSPILAVARLIVDLQPPGAKELVVELFGAADKAVVQLLIVTVALGLGALVGLLRADPRPGRRATAGTIIAGLGIVVWVGATRDPRTDPIIAAVVATLVVVVAGGTLQWLIGGQANRHPATRPGMPAPLGAPMPDWGRRQLLQRGGGLAVASIAIGALGRTLVERGRTPTASHLPSGAIVPSDLPPGAELGVDGITPLVVPNDAFYRIDTDFISPDVDVATWQLRIHGMVERETTLTFAELTALPPIDQYVTIACVSNKIGGDLVGNALWSGVRLRDVLEIAGVRPEATQLVGRSVNGWTAGMPTAWILDPEREPMIATHMNGEPLPRGHGYPVRLIVPGLYGYVSATKWLGELELTTMEAFDAYWVPLGWAKEAPILTQSRIDVPGDRRSLPIGRTAIAGVAWAPDRGVSRVEVAVDGEWHEATISTPLSGAAWVQWLLDWDATAGSHTLEVRATDGNGAAQTVDRTPPAPDGARGHHTIRVTVG